MTQKKQKPGKQGAVTLEESALENVQGGLLPAVAPTDRHKFDGGPAAVKIADGSVLKIHEIKTVKL